MFKCRYACARFFLASPRLASPRLFSAICLHRLVMFFRKDRLTSGVSAIYFECSRRQAFAINGIMSTWETRRRRQHSKWIEIVWTLNTLAYFIRQSTYL